MNKEQRNLIDYLDRAINADNEAEKFEFDNSQSKFVPREIYEKAYLAWKRTAKKWRSEGLWADKYFSDWRATEALAADRLELAKVVNRHCKDRMHSDMKLGWEMAQKVVGVFQYANL